MKLAVYSKAPGGKVVHVDLPVRFFAYWIRWGISGDTLHHKSSDEAADILSNAIDCALSNGRCLPASSQPAIDILLHLSEVANSTTGFTWSKCHCRQSSAW